MLLGVNFKGLPNLRIALLFFIEMNCQTRLLLFEHTKKPYWWFNNFNKFNAKTSHRRMLLINEFI